ncbi:HD domain-containing protein, partial [Oscillibacter sp.]|uniref:HD-GYP domain-containing protein n=1 Tax=Oscillibacter sp. TaxID=1945593 RepID=UPI0028B01F6A
MTYYNRYFATLYDLIACMTAAVDLLDVRVSNHHQRVAFMSLKLAEQMGLSLEERRALVQAALLHDIGALTLSERLQLVTGEASEPEGHARIGARFLEDFPPLRCEAEIVRFHHVPWKNGVDAMHHGAKVPLLSHVLHLADRVVVQIRPDMSAISQIGTIRDIISAQRGEVFVPETVDAFMQISLQEALWLELVDGPQIHDFLDELSLDAVKLTLDEA